MRKRASQEPKTGPTVHTHLVVIEAADPFILTEVRSDPKVGPLIIAQLSDRVALAAPGSAERLLRALLKAGHTPRVTSP